MATHRLPRALRIALDAVRGLAALEVVAHHLTSVNAYGGPELLRVLFGFGQEAVMVFFLLSGFLVYANEYGRPGPLRGYFFRRFRRIYPPLAIALLLSIAIAVADGDLAAQFRPSEVIGTLFAMQDNGALKPGVLVDPPFHNTALWSLSYEIGFYLLFPLIAAALRRRPTLTRNLIGAASVGCFAVYLVRPGHVVIVVAYLLVWWCGAAVARAFLAGRLSVRSLAPELGWLTALLALAVGASVRLGYGAGPAHFPLLMVRHFGVALVLVGVVAVLAPALAATGRLSAALGHGLEAVAQPAAFLASVSYGLYVFHWPILLQWQFPHTGPAAFAVAVAVLVVAVLVGDRWMDRVPMRRRRQKRPVVVV